MLGVRAQPVELAACVGTTQTGKRIERVVTGRAAGLLLGAEAREVSRPDVAQGFGMQIGDDVGLVEAVLRQLTAGRQPPSGIDVRTPERKGIAPDWGFVGGRTVVDLNRGPAARPSGITRERVDLADHGEPLLGREIRIPGDTPRHRLRQYVMKADAPEPFGQVRRGADLMTVAPVDNDGELDGECGGW